MMNFTMIKKISAQLDKFPLFYPLFVVLSFSIFLFLYSYRYYSGNITGFLCIGKYGHYDGSEKGEQARQNYENHPNECHQFWDDTLIIGNHRGYDSQYYYFMALNPFRPAEEFHCTRYQIIGAYRYQRILYPLLSHLAALGKKTWVPYAMLFVLLLSIFIGTLTMVKICKMHSISTSFSLFYGFSLIHLITTMRTLTDPLYICLLLLSFYCYFLKKTPKLAFLLLSFAVLTKEIALATAAGFIAYELFMGKNLKNLKGSFLPFGAYAVIQAIVHWKFGIFSMQVPGPSSLTSNSLNMFPFEGLFKKAIFFIDHPLQIYWPDVLGLFNVLVIVIFILIYIVKQCKGAANQFIFPALFYLCLVHLASSIGVEYIDIWGYGRHSMELLLVLQLVYVLTRKKLYLMPMIFNVLCTFILAKYFYGPLLVRTTLRSIFNF